MNNPMKSFLSSLAVVLLCGAVVMADPPADPPSDGGQAVDRPADRPPPPMPPAPAQASPGERPPRGGRPSLQPLTAEQQAELLKFVQEHLPSQYEDFVKLSETKPRNYQFVMARMWAWYEQWKVMSPEAQEASITEHELRMEAFMVLRKFRETEDPAEKEQIKAELREALERHFDAEQRLREVQLAELEECIGQVRQELQQRTEDRDAIVAENMEQMLKFRSRHRDNPPEGERPADATPPDAPPAEPPPADPPADEGQAD
jgi:hypothetical protein